MHRPSKNEIKITILKAIEVSLNDNNSLTTSIFAKSGLFKISINQQGKATISGAGRFVTVDVGQHLDLGVKFKMLNVSGHITESGDVNYKGVLTWGVLTISTQGSFNFNKFFDMCQSPLCKAARLRRDRGKFIEEQLKKAGVL